MKDFKLTGKWTLEAVAFLTSKYVSSYYQKHFFVEVS